MECILSYNVCDCISSDLLFVLYYQCLSLPLRSILLFFPFICFRSHEIKYLKYVFMFSFILLEIEAHPLANCEKTSPMHTYNLCDLCALAKRHLEKKCMRWHFNSNRVCTIAKLFWPLWQVRDKWMAFQILTTIANSFDKNPKKSSNCHLKTVIFVFNRRSYIGRKALYIDSSWKHFSTMCRI